MQRSHLLTVMVLVALVGCQRKLSEQETSVVDGKATAEGAEVDEVDEERQVVEEARLEEKRDSKSRKKLKNKEVPTVSGGMPTNAPEEDAPEAAAPPARKNLASLPEEEAIDEAVSRVPATEVDDNDDVLVLDAKVSKRPRGGQDGARDARRQARKETGDAEQEPSPEALEPTAEVPADDAPDLGSFGAEDEEDLTGARDWANVPGAVEAVRPVYASAGVSGFVSTAELAYSTFSADVDTASYANIRRMLRAGVSPPAEAVRVEEFVNSLPYDYAKPGPGEDFSVDLEASVSPWNAERHVVRVGVQARRAKVVPLHLTVLVDVSPSMAGRNKLDLAKRVTDVICRQLGPTDTLELLTFSDAARVVSPRAPGQRLHDVSEALRVDGGGQGTALGAGLRLAYDRARASRREGAVSRVVLLADGDANVGANSLRSLLAVARSGVDEGVALTTVGFGGDGLNDVVLEALADRSDGNYHFIDSIVEARRVFEEQLRPTMQVVAQDVKLQVRWNPTAVASWRLVGYENRALDSAAFYDDDVDAGEVGSGHQVTAVYEIELAARPTGALGSVHIRHRAPGSTPSVREFRQAIPQDVVAQSLMDTSDQFRLQLAAVGLAERLRGSEHIRASYSSLGDLAIGAMRDRYPEDLELLELIDRASRLAGGRGMASRPGFGPR